MKSTLTKEIKREQKKERKAKKKERKLEKKARKLPFKMAKKEKKKEKKREHRMLNEPPRRSVLEEVGNAVTHGVGALFALVALILMLLSSNSIWEVVASCVYGGSIFFMMLMSCLYHSFKGGSTVKRIWRRFDYSSIYLLIGGTFAPLLLIFIGDTLGIVLFFIQWAVIITGITMVAVFGPGRLKWLHFTLYFVLGWSGLALIPSFIAENISLFYYILGGGLVYTLGMIPFVTKKKSAHFIWHFFVLIGAIVQFIGIYLYVY